MRSTSRPCCSSSVAEGAAESGLGPYVDGDELRVEPLRHTGGTAHEPVPVGRACQGDEHPFAGLPGLGDPVSRPVVSQALLDAVGDPEQCELAQGGEVAGPEVVAQSGIDALGRVDVAACETRPDGLDGQVDQLELVRAAHDQVGDRLALDDPGDLFDHVVERFQMLDVQIGEDADARVEQLVHVLPALLVARARHVRVRQLVDEGESGWRASTASTSISANTLSR